MTIFDNIRMIALIKGTTLKDLCEGAGMDRQVFYNAEKRGSIETKNLQSLAENLKVHPSMFYRDIDKALLDTIERMNSELTY